MINETQLVETDANQEPAASTLTTWEQVAAEFREKYDRDINKISPLEVQRLLVEQVKQEVTFLMDKDRKNQPNQKPLANA